MTSSHQAYEGEVDRRTSFQSFCHMHLSVFVVRSCNNVWDRAYHLTLTLLLVIIQSGSGTMNGIILIPLPCWCCWCCCRLSVDSHKETYNFIISIGLGIKHLILNIVLSYFLIGNIRWVQMKEQSATKEQQYQEQP